MSISIEQPKDSMHVPTLQGIQTRAGDLFRQVGMSDVADSPPTLVEVFEKAILDQLLYTASMEMQIAGFALALNHGRVCHLEQMSVDPSFARRGVGASLVRFLVAEASSKGYQSLSLSTFLSLPWNAPFYAKLGFKVASVSTLSGALLEVRREEKEAGLDMSDRVIMTLDLCS